MTDEAQAIQLVQRTGREALSVDQLFLLHQSGALRPLPGEGRRLQIIGSAGGYLDEVAWFHPDLAAALVERGAAVYV